MTEINESVLYTPELEHLEEQLEEAQKEMELMAKSGKYVLAENLRLNVEQLKKELDSKRMKEVKKRQHQ